MPTEQEILKAIPRRKVIAQFILMLAGGGLLVVLNKLLFMPWLKAYLSVGDRVEALHRLAVVLGSVVAVMLGLALWAALLARRIFVSGQFPAPGTRVWRDTPIVRGRAARARAWVLTICALLAFVCAILAAWLPYSLR